ncbi:MULTISPECIES: LysR substrate-binding domain-containing protein [unclassified Microbacterium]|uniref:LysR substrate-binding domain-containing protein n=1 Tax=unclassified Microbacterium TaxID=2609290 RepID=UPI000EA8A195|nr:MULTISPECIES: LysR substrate-binding domain-containing protein [unclassified Microbacterium]MBT2483419.1 substrate-binding domain-containing protein [Microbacterium sp. ISL-108]RKN66447.1 transcriptional regulator [Microbacterium sp. CGR2]
MANGRRPAKRAGKGTPVRRNKAAPAERFPPRKPGQKTAKKNEPVVFDASPESEEPRTFRLGVVPGATPGKWIGAWKQRMPQVPLELIPVDPAEQRTAIDAVDAALVRLPLDDPSLHIISLYDEVSVVVAAVDSHLMAAEELTAADLEGEVVIALTDDVLGPVDLPGTTAARFAALPTDEAIATAATGVGIVIVPMSLARLHHRKDADQRRLVDGPLSTVALVWPRERTTPDVETFVGIVRGRTANSSR